MFRHPVPPSLSTITSKYCLKYSFRQMSAFLSEPIRKVPLCFGCNSIQKVDVLCIAVSLCSFQIFFWMVSLFSATCCTSPPDAVLDKSYRRHGDRLFSAVCPKGIYRGSHRFSCIFHAYISGQSCFVMASLSGLLAEHTIVCRLSHRATLPLRMYNHSHKSFNVSSISCLCQYFRGDSYISPASRKLLKSSANCSFRFILSPLLLSRIKQAAVPFGSASVQ